MKTRNLCLLLVIACTISLLGLLAGVVAEEPVKEKPLKVLVITGGHGFDQKAFFAMFDGMEGVQYDKAQFPDAAKLLTAATADSYDVLVLYDMARGITPEQQKAFVALLKKGIGVVALHHTLGAHRDWPEYKKIIGGRYNFKKRVEDGKEIPASGYSHGEDIKVSIADAKHPITAGMKDFTIHDETYNNYETIPSARILLKTDHLKNDPELGWVLQYEKSPVFYLMLGHDGKAYTNPAYKQLVRRGIDWSAGRLK